MNPRLRFALGAVSLAAAFLFAAAGPLHAHGVLERSDPAAGVSLNAPPPRVVLWFSEPVDPVLSSASISDAQGRRISGRAAIASDRRSLIVPLEQSRQGLFTVTWSVLSTVDGHVTRGAFLFGVGQPVPGGPAAQAAPPNPLSVAARWGAFLAAIVLAGSLFFQLLIGRPARRRVTPPPQADARAGRALRRLQVATGVVLITAVSVEFLITASSLVEVPLTRALSTGLLWPLLFGTKTGWSVLVRLGMALLLLLPAGRTGRLAQSAGLLLIVGVAGLATVYRSVTALASPTHTLHLVAVAGISLGYGLVSAIRRPPDVDWVPSVAGAGLLAGFTINSHAFGRGAAAAVADWTHLLAAALWIGGLVSLLLITRAHRFGASPERRADSPFIPALAGRWSFAAGMSLGVLVLTGLYGMWLHLPRLSALTQTPYGRALSLKLILVAVLAMLGALNHFLFRPRVGAPVSEARPPRRFLRALRGEIGVGTAVLLVVAVLTITPPASVVSTTAARQPLRLAGLTGAASEVEVRLAIAPAQPGWNNYQVDVATGGAPLSGPARVLLRLTHLETALTPVLVRLEGREVGRYSTSGGELVLPGWWEVGVIVRRAGRPDESTAFPLRIGTPAARPSDPAALRLLDRARRAAGALRTWRQTEQITDGKGGAVLAVFDLQPPDRMRYRTSSGQEAIIVGARRFLRSGGSPWEEDTLPERLRLEGLGVYMRDDAQSVRAGRPAECEGGEPCRVILWETPGGSTAFAGWVGLRSGRLYRLLMIAPAHFMTLHVRDFNAPIQIGPP